MDLYEYQEKARSTAIYLDIEGSRMIYPALGIVGECGEVIEKTKKIIRDDNWDITDDRKDAIAKELGDCCWYLANICCDTNLDLGMMYEMRGYIVIHQIRDLSLPRVVLHMSRHAMVVASTLENWYYTRDSHIAYCGHYVELPKSLSHIITCVEEIARRCGFTIEDICINNIEKLASRKERGTIKGSGDER